MTSNFIQDSKTPGRKCGWIGVDSGPKMRTRQEMMPHIPKAELKFNDVWMNERIGGSNDTTKEIVSRNPCKLNPKKRRLELKWDENRVRVYLSLYQRSGMPEVWRIRTRYFPSTSPCIAAYSTDLQYIQPSLQAELSILTNVLQMAVRPAFQPHQLRTRDIHASRASVWR